MTWFGRPTRRVCTSEPDSSSPETWGIFGKLAGRRRQTAAALLPPQGVTVVTGVMAATGLPLGGRPPADREPRRPDCHTDGHRGCRCGSACEYHADEDVADGIGPQTEDRRQPVAEAQCCQQAGG